MMTPGDIKQRVVLDIQNGLDPDESAERWAAFADTLADAETQADIALNKVQARRPPGKLRVTPLADEVVEIIDTSIK